MNDITMTLGELTVTELIRTLSLFPPESPVRTNHCIGLEIAFKPIGYELGSIQGVHLYGYHITKED